MTLIQAADSGWTIHIPQRNGRAVLDIDFVPRTNHTGQYVPVLCGVVLCLIVKETRVYLRCEGDDIRVGAGVVIRSRGSPQPRYERQRHRRTEQPA